MAKLYVLLFAAIFAAQMLTGCGKAPGAEKKPLVIKPMEVAPEKEESDEDEDAPASAQISGSGSPAKTVTESAIEKASAIQESQSKYQVQPAALLTPKQVPLEAPKPSETLLLADFDSGEKPNNVGGNFGAWNKDPSDPTQWCRENFDNTTRREAKGFSMKLDYSVDSPNPAYNGFWMMMPNMDASKYDSLNFWVKGDPQAGYTTVFKVELKNANKQVGRHYISTVGDQWQHISIPLSEFKSLIDRTNLTEFVIVFEDRMATKKKGVIYIDDITFTQK